MANYSRGRDELKIGVLAAAAIIIFMVMFAVLTDRGLTRHRSTVHVLLSSAEKLKRGDRVLYRGVPVGEVRGLEFARGEGVVATLRITRRLDLTRASTVLLLGDFFGSQSVLLQAGDPLAPPLRSGDTLSGVTAPALSGKLEAIGEQAGRLLGDTTTNLIHHALAGTAGATGELRGLAVAAHQMIDAQAPHLTRTTASAAEMTANLSRITGSDELSATVRNLEAATANLARATARMDTAALALGSIMRKVDDGQGSLGRLVNDQSLYEQLMLAASDAGALVHDVKANPKRYLTVKVF